MLSNLVITIREVIITEIKEMVVKSTGSEFKLLAQILDLLLDGWDRLVNLSML